MYSSHHKFQISFLWMQNYYFCLIWAILTFEYLSHEKSTMLSKHYSYGVKNCHKKIAWCCTKQFHRDNFANESS